ncbi:MAG: hypothetical protein IKI30_03530 [Oxalobacter sp.]|nr:hypothetical protein [Oxalobacter sp.]
MLFEAGFHPSQERIGRIHHIPVPFQYSAVFDNLKAVEDSRWENHDKASDTQELRDGCEPVLGIIAGLQSFYSRYVMCPVLMGSTDIADDANR